MLFNRQKKTYPITRLASIFAEIQNKRTLLAADFSAL